ncbi:MAG: XRE family transcriptional regulator [Treponema sp.]|jgi:SOS-response transcriptional repressor LexA|nr:XRE family transcriptional regulator [Treponema sp.]
MLRNNLKTAIAKSGFIVKEIAAKSGVNKRTIDKWVGSEETEPKVNDLYKVCEALGITVEWVVAGDAGLDYVRRLIAKEGKLWDAPERIRAIVKVLEGLDDGTLRTVRKMITALQYEAEAPVYPLYTRDPAPEYEYDPVAINISRFIPKSNRMDNVQVVKWDMLMLPFYGNTAAGYPIDISYYPDQAIPFPHQKLKGRPENFFSVRVKGTSMSKAGINDGDYVVIRRAEEPVDGKIMLVRYENESTLKRINIKEGRKGRIQVYICWEDGSGETRLLDSSEYEIQGELFWNLRE